MVNPRTQNVTHINIKSQKERYTINRAELAAITFALKMKNAERHLKILTGSSFCINTIRNYTIDPASYPMKTTHSPPKPYKLRPQKVQKAPNIRKRKTHYHNPQYDNQL